MRITSCLAWTQTYHQQKIITMTMHLFHKSRGSHSTTLSSSTSFLSYIFQAQLSSFPLDRRLSFPSHRFHLPLISATERTHATLVLRLRVVLGCWWWWWWWWRGDLWGGRERWKLEGNWRLKACRGDSRQCWYCCLGTPRGSVADPWERLLGSYFFPSVWQCIQNFRLFCKFSIYFLAWYLFFEA